MDLHTFRRDEHRPEQTTWSDAGLEIMNLMSKVSLTLKEIQSNERKGASVTPTIHSYVLTQHEPHIGVKDKPSLGVVGRVLSRAHTSDVCDPDETVEIRNRRRLVAGPG